MIHSYETIISIGNLYRAWREFVSGKARKQDVALFALDLSKNIFDLHQELKGRTYQHGPYKAFKINDPKPRDIHKSSVRDRLLHHAIYRVLYRQFDKKFIYDSYSCRNMKGTHRAFYRFFELARRVSRNNHRTCFVLKCDIRKFFASIDHKILKKIIANHIADLDTRALLGNVIDSFHSRRQGVGLPLGNLTSQLLVNIYMNEFDQFVKRQLKIKHYIRYADDFVFLSEDRTYLESLLPKVQKFLHEQLKLELHPDKVFIKTLSSGVDFLGWVHFPDHRVLRTATKRRMFRNLEVKLPSEESVQSYLGLLRHGNAHKIKNQIEFIRQR